MILTHGANSVSAGGNSPLPQNCVLLDYFTNGYRFGVQSTGNSPTSVNQESISFLDYSSIFPNGMPIAVFDGTDSNADTNYDITNSIDISVGYTIEFWMKLSTSSTSWFLSTCFTKYDNSTDWNTLFRNVYTGYNWKTTSGTMSYNMTSYSSVATWHHFALVRSPAYMTFYTDGGLSRQLAYQYPSSPLSLIFALRQYAGDVNSSFAKRGSYSITQLAVWNYQKYSAGFTPSTKLIIDPTYT